MVVLAPMEGLFWGVTLDGEKRFSQTVEDDFHVSMAALEPGLSNGSQVVSLMLQHEGSEFMLCTLEQGKLYQQPLDLNFASGENVTFFLTGEGRVHLSGYLSPDLPQDEFGQGMDSDDDEEGYGLQGMESDDSDGSDDSEDEAPMLVSKKRKTNKKDMLDHKRARTLLDDEASEDDDDEYIDHTAGVDFEESWDDEEDDDEPVLNLKKQLLESLSAKKKNKKDKKDKTTPQKPQEATSSKAKETTPNQGVSDGLTKSQKKKKRKRNNSNNEPVTPNGVANTGTPKSEKKGANTPAEKKQKANTPTSAGKQAITPGSGKKNKGQLLIQDLKEGHGPAPKEGQTVGMFYTGKLTNGHMFDAHIAGKPFKYKYGKSEVIPGWDMGIKGLKVGGKRRLTIPPKLAYGHQAVGDIPANSTLIFDVELKSVS